MLPLFDVVMPANASSFFSQIMQIAAFDVYDFADIIHDGMDIPPTEPFAPSFEAVGFESEYLLVNMGSLMVPWLVIALLMALAFLINKCNCECTQKLQRSIAKFLFWGPIITLINESYMIVITCLLINLQSVSFATPGLAVMSSLCIAFIGIYTILPAIFIFRICLNRNKLHEHTWKNTYGNYYKELRLPASKSIFMYPSFFLVRRLLVGVAVCLVGRLFIWQLCIYTV